MKHLLTSTIIAALIVLTLFFTNMVLVDVIRDQLQRTQQLQIENKQKQSRIDELLEELAGIKVEKVPEELLIH